jgi:hypothetical protein
MLFPPSALNCPDARQPATEAKRNIREAIELYLAPSNIELSCNAKLDEVTVGIGERPALPPGRAPQFCRSTDLFLVGQSGSHQKWKNPVISKQVIVAIQREGTSCWDDVIDYYWNRPSPGDLLLFTPPQFTVSFARRRSQLLILVCAEASL